MEFFVIWLGSIVISFWMGLANELKMFKDAADSGYKINIKRMEELQKQGNKSISTISSVSMFIPIFNIVQIFMSTVQSNKMRPLILEQLRIMNVLEKMSEIEKQEYLKKPTGLNAISVPIKLNIRLQKACLIKIPEENGISEYFFELGKYFFELGESHDDIVILKVTGPAANLTVEEQKKIVAETFKDMTLRGMEKYGGLEKFLNVIQNEKKVDITSNQDEKSENVDIQKIDEQKHSIDNIENDLAEAQYSSQELHIEKSLALTKRKINNEKNNY